VQLFHWLTAILVLAAYVLSKSDGSSLYSADADGLRRVHETLGVLVFFVVVLRLSWGLIDNTSVKRPASPWMDTASKLVQLALYALLVSIPATAVFGTWLEGIPITLIGLDIAPQIGQVQRLGQQVMDIHIILGEAMLWVAGAHAAAALFHYFFLHDGVLQSMLPGE